jgi:hypothetical protein
MMELHMVVRLKVSTTNMPDGQLQSVDGRLWQNDGSILNHTQGC